MSSYSTFQTNLDKFIPVCMTFCLIAIIGDGAINALYILESRSVDGATLGDSLLAVGFLILWVGAIRALTMLGLEVLPHAPKRRISRELSPKVNNYAANFFCFSGLSNTPSTLSQFRISPLQRSGCRNFAC